MQEGIKDSHGRLALLAVCFGVAALLVFEAGEMWLARLRVESGQLRLMERGAALLPGNAVAWDRLGELQQWDFANPSISDAIADYQKAVQVDPLSAHYWMDLASAYDADGESIRAKDAYAHAKAVYPISADVAFQYGNFLLRQQDYRGAYRELQQAVRTDQTLIPLAISRTWRATEEINPILEEVLPARPEAYLQALDYFVSIRRIDIVFAVWQRLLQLGKPFSLTRTFHLLDELILEDRSDDARRVWREAVASSGLSYQEPANHSMIWNGTFQTAFANGGLDWRWSPLVGVSIDIDFQPGPNGSRAVQLDFGDGSNLALDEPLQYVPVEPSRNYHFHAYMRTEQITTESGMRFSITDPNHSGAVNSITDNFTGSRPWTAVEADLATPAETHFLVVRLMRNPSRLFDNKLSGTAWIADVSLIPSGTTERPSR